MTRIGAGLTAAARGRHGVWVQHKPAAVALHTRMAGAVEAEAATAQALTLATSLGVDALQGKDVVEISVLGVVTKGHALVTLRDELGARVVLYAGDDTTDIDAFRAVDDMEHAVRVAVVSSESPAMLRAYADIVVESTEEFLDLLRRL